MSARSEYFFKHWKLGVHLVLRTKRFGVNNAWWSAFDSRWGKSWWRILLSVLLVKPILDNYYALRVRMSHSHGWVPAAEYEKVFGSKRLYDK